MQLKCVFDKSCGSIFPIGALRVRLSRIGGAMKILGWLLLGATTLAFAYCFCQQQLLVQADQLAHGGTTARFEWDDLPDQPDVAPQKIAPSTQPSRETTVASNDLTYVTK
jgi:hypothetical protein